MIEEFISRILCCHNQTAIAHWKSKSFSEHEALGDFYGSIIGILDRIVETHQGVSGLVSEIEYHEYDSKNILEYLKEELVWIVENQKKLSDGISSISNIIDEMVALFLKTIYKLENLK
jgi:hypothetical protein